MTSEIQITAISRIVKKSIQEQILSNGDTSAIFYDLDFLERKVEEIVSFFPKNSVHAVAIKANPLPKILQYLKKKGIGLEAASLPELTLALNLEFPPEKIVFDSPIKTYEEIEIALKADVHINIDSLQELSRIVAIKQQIKSNSTIGFRINPQVGKGTILSTSVADQISKFGIPLNNNKQRIINSFLKYEWLTGLHVHVGSQGMSPDLILEGIKKVFNLSEEINTLLEKSSKDNRVNIIDIGGGFPVKYRESDESYSFENFVKKIKDEIPDLFSNQYKIITEYGRTIHANASWALSRVEYVKRNQNSNIIVTHLGADFLLRKAYNPKDWHHKISVLDSHGDIKKTNEVEKYSIAGPLCFSGDFIDKDILLPKVDEGDYIVIHDVGAYTLSMWSRYNSRQVPKIIGYTKNNIEILKERESVETTLKFWC